MEIIIEEVSRDHKLLHRHRVNQDTVTIGRGYHNDIILSDPHACPEHLSLNFDGESWQLTDKDSVNGTFLVRGRSKKQNADQQSIQDGDLIVLGKSQLRVIFKERQVAETIALSPYEHLIDIIRHPVASILSIAIFFMVCAHTTYLNQVTETHNISQIFIGGIKITLLFAIWPATVALVSQLTKNDPRILAQLGISFTFFSLMWLSDKLEALIIFNSASNSGIVLLYTVIPLLLAFSLFWLNTYVSFHVSARRRLVSALSITAVFFGGSALIQYSKQPEFNPYPSYDSTLMTPSFIISSSSSVDEFITESQHLFEQAKEKAKE